MRPTRRPKQPPAGGRRAARASAHPRALVNAAQARAIFDALDTQHPGADTELHFRNAYELLVATILSAQCTDARVNQVTPRLFGKYPDVHALSAVEPEALEPDIQSTGFFRMKARALSGMARAIVAKHGSTVPSSMDALVQLPGVGRKTANVVLGHALGVPGFPVDRHVLRVANRLGLVASDDPIQVEAAITSLLPPDRWTRGSDALILHGRRVCRPTPICDRCQARALCAYYRKLGASASRAKVRPTRARS